MTAAGADRQGPARPGTGLLRAPAGDMQVAFTVPNHTRQGAGAVNACVPVPRRAVQVR